MKALNRAIARTVSQLGRYGREGCHPPMLMALENHLDALLTMERKQLEHGGIQIARAGDKSVVNITSTGCGGRADGKAVADLILRELERTKAPEGVVAFSTPQEKNGSLFDRFVADGMMEQDGFRDSGEARKLGITPARIMAQMHPGEGGTMAALEKACEAASNFASEGARYLQQRDDALAALVDALDSLEYVEKHMPGMNGFMVRQERIARARTIIAKIKGSATCEQPQLPAYQVGDMLERVRHGNKQWTVGKLYEIQKVDGEAIQLLGDDGRPYWTRQENLAFSNRGKVAPPPPAPDAIDMTDSHNWQIGDVLMCSDGNAFLGFNAGDECAVTEKHKTYVVVRRNHGTAVALHHGLPASSAFTWLRHGEAQQ